MTGILVSIPATNGCSVGSDCYGHFYIGAGFTEDQQTAILEGVSRMNEWAGKSVAYVGPGSGSACPILVEDLDGEKVGIHRATGPFGTQPEYIGIDLGRIEERWTDPGERYRVLVITAQHELWHSLGMEHVNGGGIMGHSVGPNSQYNETDRQECRRIGVCEQ